MMKKYFFILAVLVAGVCNAQLDQYQFYIGAVGYASDDAKDIRGVPRNYFANFKSSPLIGLGFSMYLSDHIRMGANVEATSTSQDHYAMSFTSINPTFTYHILPFDKRISPFVSVNASLSFLNLRQDPYTYIAYPQTGYSKPDITNPLIVKEEISMPYFYLQSQPMMGWGFGLGADVKLKKHIGLILCLNYNSLLDESNPVINKNLTFNQYNLSYTTLNIMLRYRIF